MNSKQLDDFNKKRIDAIKELFGDKIKQNFLLEILDSIKEKMGLQIFAFFPNSFTLEGQDLLRGNNDRHIEYEICRNIVAIHRCHTIFMDDHERANLQKSNEYKDALADQVIEHIRIRNYSGVFARTYQLMEGEDYFFYPLSYKLFAICMRSYEILKENTSFPYFDYYSMIANKCLSALCLLENGMFDSIYQICRTMIELYIKMSVIMINSKAYTKYQILRNMDIERACNNKNSDDFKKMYDNRKYNSEKNQIDYLHYGWVDDVDDYSELIKGKHYSMNSLFEYLFIKYEKDNLMCGQIEELKSEYNFCHAFTHGSIGSTRYPIVDYLNITIILTIVLGNTYIAMCNHLNVSKNINDLEIVKLTERDFSEAMNQRLKCSTPILDKYYSNLLNVK